MRHALLALVLAGCAPAAAVGPEAHAHTGTASYVHDGLGARYLALPEGKGHAVRICALEHTARCVERRSTDAGPDLAMQRAGRVADLSAADFRYLCGCSGAVGLMRVEVQHLGARAAEGTIRPPRTQVRPTLPPTDGAE